MPPAVLFSQDGELTVFCSDENCYGVGWEEGGILHGSWTHLLLFHSASKSEKKVQFDREVAIIAYASKAKIDDILK